MNGKDSRAVEILKKLKDGNQETNEAVDAKKIIKELIETGWSGSDKEQGKAVQLLRGLAFSEEEVSNKFMKKIDEFTSSLDPKDFE